MSADLKNANDSRPLDFSASKGNLEATKALVERGAPLNNANKNSAIPLILGARYGKIEVFCYLTEIGSDINPLNAELNPICHLLALLGAHHILHISRIRLNIPDAEKTLLFAMLLFSDIVEIIKMLLDNGMSVDLKNAEDFMLLHFSSEYCNLCLTWWLYILLWHWSLIHCFEGRVSYTVIGIPMCCWIHGWELTVKNTIN